MRAEVRLPGVVICGGGVAGVEALLALRALAGDRVDIHLVTPNRRFLYHPLAVAAPFGLAETRRFDLAEITHTMRAELHEDSLARVDTDGRCARLESGIRLHYDALIIAVGPRRRDWLDGALHFGGAADVAAFSALLDRLMDGRTTRLGFVHPETVSWPLPLYELALLTASHLADNDVAGVELTLMTPDSDPLAVFGSGASRMMRELLANRGITLRTGVAARGFEHGRLHCGARGELEFDEVLALSALEGRAVPGVSCDESGFMQVDEHSRVVGLPDVYGAGDGTNFPVKQGGIATQQADAAAEEIAAKVGAPVTPTPLRPTLRAVLLNGIAPLYLRSQMTGEAVAPLEMAGNPLWIPPTKVAGFYLAPYLQGQGPLSHGETLQDRSPSAEDPASLRRSHDEARDLALAFADRDAHDHDFDSALQWLDALERLEGVLPPGYLAKREEWRRRVAAR